MHCLYVQMSQLDDLGDEDGGAMEDIMKEVKHSLTGDLLQGWARKSAQKEEELKKFVSATAAQDFKLSRHPEEHLKIQLSEADMKTVADFSQRMDLDEMQCFDIWLLMVKNYIEVYNEGDGVCASFLPSFLPASVTDIGGPLVEDQGMGMMSYLYLEQLCALQMLVEPLKKRVELLDSQADHTVDRWAKLAFVFDLVDPEGSESLVLRLVAAGKKLVPMVSATPTKPNQAPLGLFPPVFAKHYLLKIAETLVYLCYTTQLNVKVEFRPLLELLYEAADCLLSRDVLKMDPLQNHGQQIDPLVPTGVASDPAPFQAVFLLQMAVISALEVDVKKFPRKAGSVYPTETATLQVESLEGLFLSDAKKQSRSTDWCILEASKTVTLSTNAEKQDFFHFGVRGVSLLAFAAAFHGHLQSERKYMISNVLEAALEFKAFSFLAGPLCAFPHFLFPSDGLSKIPNLKALHWNSQPQAQKFVESAFLFVKKDLHCYVEVLQRLLYHSVACLTLTDEHRGKPAETAFPIRFLLSKFTLSKIEARSVSDEKKAEAQRRVRSDSLEDVLGFLRAVCKLMPILRTPSSQSPDHHYQIDQQLRGSGVPSLQKFFLESGATLLLQSGEPFLEIVKEQLRSEFAPKEDVAFRPKSTAGGSGSSTPSKPYQSSQWQSRNWNARDDREVASNERTAEREFMDPRRVLRDRRMCEEMFLRVDVDFSMLCPYVETLAALLSCEGEEDAVVIERSEEQGFEMSHQPLKSLTLQDIMRFDDPLRGWLPGLPWTEEGTYMNMRDSGMQWTALNFLLSKVILLCEHVKYMSVALDFLRVDEEQGGGYPAPSSYSSGLMRDMPGGSGGGPVVDERYAALQYAAKRDPNFSRRMHRRYELLQSQLQGALVLARESMKRSSQELFLCERNVPLQPQDPQFRFLFDTAAFYLVEVQKQVSTTGLGLKEAALKGSIMRTLACLTGNRPEAAEKMWTIMQWAKFVPPESDPRMLYMQEDHLLPVPPQDDMMRREEDASFVAGEFPWNIPRTLSRIESEHGYYPELIGFLTLLHSVVCQHPGGGDLNPDPRSPQFNDETFRPYLKFLVNTVLLQFDERWYEFESQCWKIVAIVMSIFAEIVHKYDALKDFSMINKQQQQTDHAGWNQTSGAPHQLGYTLMRQLLQESPLLKKLFSSVLGVEFFLGQGENADVGRNGFRFARAASNQFGTESSKVRKGEPRLTDCRQQYPQSTCRLAAIACSHFSATIPSAEHANAQGDTNHSFSDATVSASAAASYGGGKASQKVEKLGSQQAWSVSQAIGAWTHGHGRYDGSCASDDEVTWKERAIVECMRLFEDLSEKESQFFDLERGMSPQSPVQRISALMTAERLSIIAGYVSYEHNIEIVLHSIRLLFKFTHILSKADLFEKLLADVDQFDHVKVGYWQALCAPRAVLMVQAENWKRASMSSIPNRVIPSTFYQPLHLHFLRQSEHVQHEVLRLLFENAQGTYPNISHYLLGLYDPSMPTMMSNREAEDTGPNCLVVIVDHILSPFMDFVEDVDSRHNILKMQELCYHLLYMLCTHSENVVSSACLKFLRSGRPWDNLPDMFMDDGVGFTDEMQIQSTFITRKFMEMCHTCQTIQSLVVENHELQLSESEHVSIQSAHTWLLKLTSLHLWLVIQEPDEEDHLSPLTGHFSAAKKLVQLIVGADNSLLDLLSSASLLSSQNHMPHLRDSPFPKSERLAQIISRPWVSESKSFGSQTYIEVQPNLLKYELHTNEQYKDSDALASPGAGSLPGMTSGGFQRFSPQPSYTPPPRRGGVGGGPDAKFSHPHPGYLGGDMLSNLTYIISTGDLVLLYEPSQRKVVSKDVDKEEHPNLIYAHAMPGSTHRGTMGQIIQHDDFIGKPCGCKVFPRGASEGHVYVLGGFHRQDVDSDWIGQLHKTVRGGYMEHSDGVGSQPALPSSTMPSMNHGGRGGIGGCVVETGVVDLIVDGWNVSEFNRYQYRRAVGAYWIEAWGELAQVTLSKCYSTLESTENMMGEGLTGVSTPNENALVSYDGWSKMNGNAGANGHGQNAETTLSQSILLILHRMYVAFRGGGLSKER
jgi:hypothetical protein